jgi:predicted permease
MKLFSNLISRIRSAMHRERDADLAEELRFHVDMEAAALERTGLSPATAREEARRRFGGVDRYNEELRDVRGGRWTQSLSLDIRFALRLLRRFPLFAAIVTLTIALGIGANTAIFSVVNAVVLRPLPFADGNRLVSLWATNPDKSVLRFGVSLPDFRDWAARTRSFSDMTLYNSGITTLAGPAGPESVAGMFVTRNFFDVLGIRPMLGRSFGSDDERGEASTTVILSYGYWQRRFGGERSIIGKTVSVNGRVRTVIGVLPREAQLLGSGFLGVPLDIVTVVEPSIYPRVERHAQHLFGAIARLKPGVTLEAARADLYKTETAIAHENADITGWTSSVFYLTDDLSLNTRQPLLILLAASGLLMVIACINVANLLLVRGAARAREIAVRQALGASRARLVSQFVVESVVLALAGGALGVAVAAGALRGIRGRIPYGVIARADDISLDPQVLLFALALSVTTALAFGLLPAWRASAFGLSTTLRDGGRGSAGATRSSRARRVMVIAEVSLALVLVVCAGLVWQSVRRMLQVDPGFRPEHTVTAQITLGKDYPDSGAVPFYRTLLASLEARPGIEAAGASDVPPLSGGGIFTSIRLIGQPPRPAGQPLMSTIRAVTPGYFRAMGIRMLRGHEIEWNEPAPSMVVSEGAAKAFWPNQSIIDKQIAFNVEPNGLPVVGEVNDTRQTSLAAAPAPIVYVSMRRTMRLFRTMTLVVRGRGDVAAIVTTIRDVVHEIDPGLPLYSVQTMQDIVDQSTAQPRLNKTLLGMFAGAALLLAGLGIYGVVSYSVAQRRQEIGVRVALGARPGDVMRLVLGEGARLAGIGVAIGVLAAVFATRLIQSWLFEIGRVDPLTFTCVAAGLVVVSLAASYIPARRATKVDPLLAMRTD